ncbi:PRELI-like family-domain-containing protein [Microdochium trichocladiopsis]|uniref:PRELI-like family-domain-containing protein n=1 Tax=Microdochium trichocladiopsis TaxID=1682393 RepID=A0A9P8Y0N8_9PEZI|nr:PRELI-like family-domain-containing protein [Microdochium trichocladiopsis]KAH7025876.1 PRELI-like family-domain-containing protein [Microdochium trichocladiopsis]
MVLTHTTNHTYNHPFPTVTLAFFLRYYSPHLNPFSSHVLSTDTISSHVDPATGRLHTTRLHVKRSRMPAAVIKLLPTSVTGGAGPKSAFVLETSVVDMKEGWMQSESRNMNYTGILSVVEQQRYSVSPPEQLGGAVPDPYEAAGAMQLDFGKATSLARSIPPNTYVTTTFSYASTLGNRKAATATQEATAGSKSIGTWIQGWGTSRIQSSIESIASNKTDDQMSKSRDGMRMVLERLRNNGVVAVLKELRRRDGETVALD